ncbi:RTC4-like domain-containing protein [Mycena galopus ATCC 62051]|nr:RTC4-like domain-containing protein [Mycena galopus ATCC 62051]
MADTPLRFCRPRQRRTKGFSLREFQDPNKSRKAARPFPLDFDGPAHKKLRIEDAEKSPRFISPDTDPTTLCPYCDRPLPPTPTPTLQRLLDVTFLNSYSDVRPANPLGRKASIMAFATLCQRHQFESETLPMAAENGWPLSIDWDALGDRVCGMKINLEDIIADAERSDRGPRMQCIFWRELLEELKSSGSRRVSGVSGQFATFNKTQPGYYGELGSAIIHRVLYSLFASETSPDLVQPLTVREFIGRILVPEVGMRLIMQDKSLDMESAVRVMRESASYGVSMFPAEDSDAEDDRGGSSVSRG